MANRTVSVKLQAEIGQYVSGMSKAAAATMRLGESATASTAKAKGGFDVAGKGALLLGGAAVAGLGMAIAKSMDFEKSMSGVAAATGATGSSLKDLRDAAIEAGSATQYSATEAADAIREMAKAGVSAADIMGGGLTGALNLAAAGQLDVAKAAEIASVAMTQFGLSGAQLPHVSDLLAAGAGKAMGSVEDMGMALNQAGLVASATGLSIEETTGTLAAFASAGLIGSDAGTSFRSMLQHLQNPSKQAAEAMADLGINMYDANGEFVGMSTLAGQLKTEMAGLTQAERDKAMATIFGSDAVRAANVLYTQGARGIEDWTTKVNDAGYAQRQAAALTDNLAGDLERLGGAFDTLMISTGSGTQGPLRELVQMLTDLLGVAGWTVEAISAIPGPVLAAAAAFGAIAVLKGPLSGFLTTMHEKAVMGAVSLLDIGRSADNAKGALSGLAGAFTPMNIGIGSAIALIPAFIGLTKGLSQNSADAAAGQRALADALRATNGVIDESTRAAAKQQLVAEGMVETLNAAGVSSKDAIDGLLGNAAAQERVTSALEDYIAAGVASGDLFGDQVTATNEAQDKYLQLAEALGMSKEEAEFFAGAVENTTGALAGSVPATTAAGAAVRDFAAEASEADEAISALQAALDELSGKTVSLFEAESQLATAVAQAEGALKDLTGEVLNADGTLNAYSESGRAAGGVLIDVRDKGNQLIATMVQQGASMGDVAKANADLRASFITAAGQMGITGMAAERLADQILGIPSERNVRVGAQTEAATIAINGVKNLLGGLADKTVTITTIQKSILQSNILAPFLPGKPPRAKGGPVWPGQEFLVGEEGPELVRFGGAGTVIPAQQTRQILTGRESTPVPAFRGREFSGGGGGGGGGTGGPIIVNFEGAQLVGTLDLGGGLQGRIDATVASAVTAVVDRGRNNRW